MTKGGLATKKYFLEAMDYYKVKLSPLGKIPIFIFASDDPVWCKEMFGDLKDVRFAGNAPSNLRTKGREVEFDLAMLIHCQHSIIR